MISFVPESHLPPRGVRPPRVLVVDDDPTIQDVFARLLRMRSYSVECARTATEAIDLARRLEIDAAVIDLMLADRGPGLDVLAWLRSQTRYRTTPLFIFTGQTVLREKDEELIRRLDAYVFYKPHAYSMLIDQLDHLIDREQREPASG